ncbi:MAG: NTP transferase domain-containing protein [Candidatus Doudnabacteria bacterium]|nr:NTP transferase domain-containing protein [Candidatus Doudnabacteria bacterium]
MRERLTITLKKEILDELDAHIDGERLRNRSHAIEYYLSKSLGQKALKVLILAGGRPAEFGAEKKLPKAMVKIAGKPLLEHTLKRLKSEKFSEVVISVGEGGEAISGYFKDGEQIGIKINYLEQRHGTKGTASALSQAKDFFKSGTFLLLYGDVLSELDYGEFLEFHRAQKSSICTMALTSVDTPKMWGMAKLSGSKIVSFEEKHEKPKTFSHLVNAGIYAMEPGIFNYIKPEAAKMESDVFPRMAEENKLSGFAFESLWLDVSNSAAYKQAVKEIDKNDKI